MRNRPVNATDSTGLIIDTIWDGACLIYDAGCCVKNGCEVAGGGVKYCFNWCTNDEEDMQAACDGMKQDGCELGTATLDLVVDGGCMLIPCVPAGGTKVVRACKGGGAVTKQVTKKVIKEKGKDVLECEAIWTAYSAAQELADGWSTETDLVKLAEKCAALSAEVAGRGTYLKKKCDYILPGSIASGSSKKEKGHEQQLADKTIAVAKCFARLARLKGLAGK